MEIYFLNWVQLSCDFGKVVPSGTTQGKVCWHAAPWKEDYNYLNIRNDVAKKSQISPNCTFQF
jgi:hypothetical protein